MLKAPISTDGVAVADEIGHLSASSLDSKVELEKEPKGQVADIENGTSDRISVLENAEDIVAQVITIEDNPSVSPWTFRMFFLGMSL